MWAKRRRAIIIFLIVSFFAIVIGFPYWYLHRVPPTCSDGQMNQNELGIDCGGACALVCPGGAKPLTILWTKVFPIRQGVYDVVSYVENGNFDIGTPSIPYVVTLFGEGGETLARVEGTTFAKPSERFTIFRGNIETGDKVAVSGTLSFPGDLRWLTEPKETRLFSIEDKVLVGADTHPRLTALLKNDNPEPYRDIDVSAIIYDEKGTPVGVSSTHVDTIDAHGMEKLSFTWPAPLNYSSEMAECAVPLDVVLVADRSGSMVDDGKLDAAKSAAKEFVGRLSPKDQAAYATFGTDASLPIDQPLTREFDRVTRAIARTEILKNSGIQFTNIGGGLVSALNELATPRHMTDSRPVIILLTDGNPTRPLDPLHPTDKTYPATYAKDIATKVKAEGVNVYTIGLGGDVDAPFLESLASSPEQYYYSASGAELSAVYQKIASAMCKKPPSVIEIIPRLNQLDQ